MGSDLHSDVALPVTSVPARFRSFMPTGRFNWAISPMPERATRQRKGKWKKKEDEKMRIRTCCGWQPKRIK
jgi:hypothetical protein